MEILFFSNEFPKDDLQDLVRRLHNRSKHSEYYALSRFIDEATSAVKKEIETLPSSLKHMIPPFESLGSWSEQKDVREGQLCGAVDGALLVFVQISIYIW